ncbi:MAG TPA: hypothetical protein VMW38_11795 [Terriglobia bacterium]|nr:hypothetical protein [Terriglobia bacterium]
MDILLFQVDGNIPNLALAKISAWHKASGDTVWLNSCPSVPDKVYSSSIFTSSEMRRNQISILFPGAITGGTGYDIKSNLDSVLGLDSEGVKPDYSLWPKYQHSIGFTARGCRLSCRFCVVPGKEGKPSSVHSVQDIWRGEPYPKHLLLLDNDFFGQPKQQWLERCSEIRHGGFKVSFNQGINIRQIDDEAAFWIASLDYRDAQFNRKCVYTAWDNLRDEARFKAGVGTLKRFGIKPQHLVVYMLIGYDSKETFTEILYRFNEITNLGCFAYPMAYNRATLDHRRFQKWAIRRYFEVVSWERFRDSHDSQPLDASKQLEMPCP